MSGFPVFIPSSSDYPVWYGQKGPEDGSVVATRVRLARNASDFAFSHRLPQQSAIRLLAQADRLVRKLKSSGLELGDCSDPEQLLQRFFRSAKGDQGLEVNHLDHFRFWSCRPGLDLDGCFNTLKPIEKAIESDFSLAASIEWGYLSPLLSNLGTGLSARVLIHLPTLNQSLKPGYFEAMVEGAADGAGTEIYSLGSDSGLYILRNTETLGIDEHTLLRKLADLARLLLHYERETLTNLVQRDSIGFEDRAWRALALLRSSRTMGIAESWSLLRTVRQGLNSGIFGGIEHLAPSGVQINAALLSCMPPWADLDDTKRASQLREAFAPSSYSEEENICLRV